jgi:excisionase family DNA binding protein
MDKVLLTMEEAAERLSLGRTVVYGLVARGELESVTVGRSRRVPVQALDAFVAVLRQGGLGEQSSVTMDGGWSRTPPAGPDPAEFS